MDLPSRSVVEEIILNPHPSPLAGRCSDWLDPPLASLYHVSLPAIYPGGKQKESAAGNKKKEKERDDLDLV